MSKVESGSDGNGDDGTVFITAAPSAKPEAVVADDSSSLISYRPIRESDYDAIKALHLELFPIEYQESYYTSAVQSVGFLGKPMRTVVAEVASTGKLVGFTFYQVRVRFRASRLSAFFSLYHIYYLKGEICY